MADFSRWCIAGETGLGLQPGSFVKAYEANRILIVGSVRSMLRRSTKQSSASSNRRGMGKAM